MKKCSECNNKKYITLISPTGMSFFRLRCPKCNDSENVIVINMIKDQKPDKFLNYNQKAIKNT